MTTHMHTPERLQTIIQTAVDDAWATVPWVFPLQQWVATHPLEGFFELPEPVAKQVQSQLSSTQTQPDFWAKVNQVNIKWAELWFGRQKATWRFPLVADGFYANFCHLAQFEPATLWSVNADNLLTSLPTDAPAAVQHLLETHFDIPKSLYATFLKKVLHTLPGWAGVARYQTRMALEGSDELYDYLAVRLVIMALCMTPEYKAPLLAELQSIRDHGLTQKADGFTSHAPLSDFQVDKRQQLSQSSTAQSIDQALCSSESALALADSHWLLCMDCRSEWMKQLLTQMGAKADGIAGFFGLTLARRLRHNQHTRPTCPIIVKPTHQFTIPPTHTRYTRLRSMVMTAFNHVKKIWATPLGMMEVIGVFAGVFLVLRTFSKKLAKQLLDVPPHRPISSGGLSGVVDALSDAEKIDFAVTCLKLGSFSNTLPKYLVLAGHVSDSTNNPYATALDCGACAGQNGGFNAQVMASLLNHPVVQAALIEKGYTLPKGFMALAAEHNTQAHTLFEANAIGAEWPKALKDALQFINQQDQAASNLAAGKQHSPKRAADWAQMRPELGLLNNSALLIGSTELQAKVNWEGRCFMHAYDASIDEDATLLAQIMAGPMWVALGINGHYQSASENTEQFGAGCKLTLNLSGGQYPMQGNSSDVMLGLPTQSITNEKGQTVQAPSPFMVLIEAPLSHIHKAIAQQPQLAPLIRGGWCKLFGQANDGWSEVMDSPASS